MFYITCNRRNGDFLFNILLLVSPLSRSPQESFILFIPVNSKKYQWRMEIDNKKSKEEGY